MTPRESQGPPDSSRLVYGPYRTPKVSINGRLKCRINGTVRVCGFSSGPITWPLGRVGHGGRGAYVVCGDLARAVETESSTAIQYWWKVSIGTVTRWRGALGVPMYNPGTVELWSRWRPIKFVPDPANPLMVFSRARLRERRLALGLTQSELAKKMGWRSDTSCWQLESGLRRRVTAQTLSRLAEVLECQPSDLLEELPHA